MPYWLDGPQDPFPPTHLACPPTSETPGLLAGGQDLSMDRLLQAYQQGIYPWYSPGQPVLWWSPDPRMVLFVSEFKLSHSLRKTLRQFARSLHSEIRIDSAFTQVMTACAQTSRPGQHGTWVAPEIIQTYSQWHQAGQAHSVETWIDGQLVGGLYGVSLGKMFFGESMFAHQTDASKIALAALICFCRGHGIDLIDCQQRTAHLSSLGAREISRTLFEQALGERLALSSVKPWQFDPALWDHLLP